jgi:hypothetical protein
MTWLVGYGPWLRTPFHRLKNGPSANSAAAGQALAGPSSSRPTRYTSQQARTASPTSVSRRVYGVCGSTAQTAACRYCSSAPL